MAFRLAFYFAVLSFGDAEESGLHIGGLVGAEDDFKRGLIETRYTTGTRYDSSGGSLSQDSRCAVHLLRMCYETMCSHGTEKKIFTLIYIYI